MSVFDRDYSRYYDLLYADKDYGAEAAYVSRLISHGKRAINGSLLELGCGTGRHAVELARLGYDVLGVDRSAAMVEKAQRRVAPFPKRLGRRLSFVQADIEKFRIRDKFDAVISLFHVISYQTTNELVFAAFKTASHHLKRNGLFIFDVWYGPAVWTQRPSTRVKRWADQEVSITRFAEPFMNPERNTVEVCYSINCVPSKTGLRKEFRESHLMRFFFLPELKFFLMQSGFHYVRAEEWLSGDKPSTETWSITVIAKRR
jgi:SAM-dependent methyltransferase